MTKTCTLEFGRQVLHLRLPAHADFLALPDDQPLPDPASEIRAALARPRGAPALIEFARAKIARKANPRAVIVVSDNTRPVPYRGPAGIILPIIDVLQSAGLQRIEILVATGTHRPLSEKELHALLPQEVFDSGFAVINHDCTAKAQLRVIGHTPRGTEVAINARYLEADLKILTGLVEPHFMAGASGGPKSVCPGLVGEQVTHVFHGAALMNDERCTSLNCTDNPCYAEALAVAEMAGVDFIVNVTMNCAKQLTGVFAGALRPAHNAAMARLTAAAAIRIAREYDLVVTHAGFVGINHYQAAKAAVEAAKAVRAGGTIVLAADHTDVDPIGGANYRKVLPMLKELGPVECSRRFFDPDWQFIPEQWEVQMWGRVFRKLGALERLVYCAPRLTGAIFVSSGVPGTDGGADLPQAGDARACAEAMVQNAIDCYYRTHPADTIAVLLDGPYGVPMLA